MIAPPTRDAGRRVADAMTGEPSSIGDPGRTPDCPGAVALVVEPEPRGRIIQAAELLLCEQGPDSLLVENICKAAGCSPELFDEAFDGGGDLLVSLFDRLASRVGQEMMAFYHAESRWDDGVRAALFKLLCFLEANPWRARFLLVETFAGDARLLARRHMVIEGFGQMFDSIDPPRRAGSTVPFGGASIVGTIGSVLHARLSEEPVPPLRELCGALMGVIVLPYLGVEAAREELSRPLPSGPADQ